MITMRGDSNGEAIVMIGLTLDNIQKLVQGLPADVPLMQVGIPGVRVVLLYGETEQKIIRIFEEAGLVAPGTASDMPEMKNPADQFHFDRRNPDEGWRKV